MCRLWSLMKPARRDSCAAAMLANFILLPLAAVAFYFVRSAREALGELKASRNGNRLQQPDATPMKTRLTILTAILLAVAAYAAPPRVALVASGGEKAEAMVALMEVEWSKRDDVVLLDRKHVKKVLTEQGLTLDGVFATGATLKAGRLLSCDLFAILHHATPQDHGEAVASLVVFDALTGMRYCDSAFPATSNIAKTAQQAGGLFAALSWLAQP